MIHKFSIPKIQTFPDVTGILGILTALENEDNWIYNNFLLLWSYKKIYDDNYWCDFKIGDYTIDRSLVPLKFVEYDKNDFNRKREVIKFLKKVLKTGYILTDLDTFYFDEWWADKNKKEHNSHTVIIFGNTKEEFLCADFLKSKYGMFSGKYIDVAEAFFRGNNKIYVLETTNDKFDKNDKLLKKQIFDFIHCSGNSITNFLDLYVYENTLYGFDALKNIFQNIIISIENNDFIDLRTTNLFLIFVRVMKIRIGFWNNNSKKEIKSIIDICTKLENKAFNLVVLCMKINYKKRCEKIEYISSLIDEIILETKDLFEGLLDYIDKDITKVEKNILWRNWDRLKKEGITLCKQKRITNDIKNDYLELAKEKYDYYYHRFEELKKL